MRGLWQIVRAAVLRRRLQSAVVAVVALLSGATVTLAAGLLVQSDAPFDHAFARQSGAHTAALFDARLASADAVRATATAPGVTAAEGPFDAVSAAIAFGARQIGNLTMAGRSNPGGPVDILAVERGHWLTGPGQIVLAQGHGGVPVGADVTIGVPGTPTLVVVGVADSATSTADAWVWPGQQNVLHADGVPPMRQMLYRFTASGTDAAVTTALARATAAMPDRALLGAGSYLVAKRDADSSTAPVIPFVVVFAVLGLVMSIVIVSNVVAGAVTAGYRTIGVLKTLGFTPGQVIAVHIAQMLLPGLLGCAAGTVLGNVLAVPLLSQAAQGYNVPSAGGLPWWVNVVAVGAIGTSIALAALLPALRAGRVGAARAVGMGRATQTGRGYRIHRALEALPLPLPIRTGLATPFDRPARTAATLVAVMLGATTVVFAAGLSTSLHRVAADFTRAAQVPVDVHLGTSSKLGAAGTPADPVRVASAIGARPGTAQVVGVTDLTATVAGFGRPVLVVGYHGDARWTGLALVSGRWYSGPDEVLVGSVLLRTTGRSLGDRITLTTAHGRRQVHIVGETFDDTDDGMAVTAAATTLTGLTTDVSPNRFEVGLQAGTDENRYVDGLSAALGQTARVSLRASESDTTALAVMLLLIGTLTILLSIVAAAAVFNTAVLTTRERVAEIGVLKTLGMTPAQVAVMVMTSLAVVGLLAGLIAAPLGAVLHRAVVPTMAAAAGTGLPPAVLDVYRPAELVGLAGAGIALAVIGALVPAGWAARASVVTALRAE